jgi:hypothetical protein
MLGQLSWLSEQAGSERRVLALDEEQELVVDQTTEQVRLLMRVKQVLKERALMLYAQPIHNREGRDIMRSSRACAVAIASLCPISLFR